MDPAMRKALETAGWKTGDAADFLEMSDDERKSLDVRVQSMLAAHNGDLPHSRFRSAASYNRFETSTDDSPLA